MLPWCLNIFLLPGLVMPVSRALDLSQRGWVAVERKKLSLMGCVPRISVSARAQVWRKVSRVHSPGC